ncbi:HlyD family type I secretion periplasmic adaptor subunit [Jannaschia sp. AI_61]|uniref:HlyD family type I secretion periplasmic adaptor subunit n=1 Tax=Jannaschia sp. AI_61 TaxID=2829796 RepID=UPI001BB8C663|nr:HlyD family type I secretion periplasmic adaptor subunit [Jannaschia sp. AI_61]GIT93279.1 HlyD family type I secretion periplasmic adaptor subunit [Jannaschia sp. AI_61]
MTALTDIPHRAPNLDASRPQRLGALALVMLIGVLGAWATFTTISGAVVANGQAVVQGKPKLIQSLDGGEVAEILVANGDVVAEGAPLLRLDPTVLEVNLDIARTRLAAALALQARLIAERSNLDAPVFTYPDLPVSPLDTTAHEIGQHDIFTARATVRQGRRERLAEALRQFDVQAEGIAGQIAAIADQTTLLDRDIANMERLARNGLLRQSQMSELQRARAQLTGQLAALEAERSRLTNARRDARLETLQAEHAFLEDVVTQMREVSAQIDELTLDIVTRTAQLARIEIRAPAAGVIHKMQATTLGGVVGPGETILEIVPLSEGVDFELRIDPRSIDQVYPGQTAQLRIASFDPQTTPKLAAEVHRISPGTLTDPQSGQVYYRVDLTVPRAELTRLGTATLVPGMPVEAWLETGDRSVLSYLLHPITNHLRHALRE